MIKSIILSGVFQVDSFSSQQQLPHRTALLLLLRSVGLVLISYKIIHLQAQSLTLTLSHMVRFVCTAILFSAGWNLLLFYILFMTHIVINSSGDGGGSGRILSNAAKCNKKPQRYLSVHVRVSCCILSNKRARERGTNRAERKLNQKKKKNEKTHTCVCELISI